MNEPKSLKPLAGQTALLYESGKVLFKKSYTKESSIYTRWDSFIGTAEEVNAKIIELGLEDLPSQKNISKSNK